jgi:hypothetical protein
MDVVGCSLHLLSERVADHAQGKGFVIAQLPVLAEGQANDKRNDDEHAR